MRINLLALVLAVAVLIGVTSIARAEDREFDLCFSSSDYTGCGLITAEDVGEAWLVPTSFNGFVLGVFGIGSIDDFPSGPGFSTNEGYSFDNLLFVNDPDGPLSIFGIHFISSGGYEWRLFKGGVTCFLCLMTNAPRFDGQVFPGNEVSMTLSFSERGGTMPPIPEPEIMALMLAGLGMISFITRRRNFARV